jgi:hypothetical protein
MAGEPIVSRRPQFRGARPPNRAITCGQRYTVRTGGCHYEPIGRIAAKSRGQTVYRDYDLSIKRQNRQNSRFRRAGQPVRER